MATIAFCLLGIVVLLINSLIYNISPFHLVGDPEQVKVDTKFEVF
jgi:hypothetical protein